MPFTPPTSFNMAEHFLDARIAEGRGERAAILTDAGTITYREVQERANRYGNYLRQAGVAPEQRVLIALPDGPEYVFALFGTLKIGAVVVMVNPHLKPDEVEYFLEYTRAKAAFVHAETRSVFEEAAGRTGHVEELLVIGEPAAEERLAASPGMLENFPTHRDDAAIWLFSGGTTGHPKAVIQTHRSFANTTDCYGRGVLGIGEDDITLSVPKLYFGYATGSNLLFPFSVGATAVLWPERCTADVLFDKIERFRPTILINVPTMASHMLAHPDAERRDVSSLRLATSAGEALPAELHDRWDSTFGVELLDGLGTAEMWHIFISNRPGDIRPGTLGRVVPGFEVRVCDDEGRELPDGEVGWLWVRGGSLALGYWQRHEKTCEAFRGEWYISGDMVSRDPEGYFAYAGRGDDMLKVSGKWLSPREVESCLLEHPIVREAAVIGILDDSGLTRPHAFVVLASASAGLPEGTPADETELVEELEIFLKDRLASYKHPRAVTVLESLPQTHLGKVDRGQLREIAS